MSNISLHSSLFKRLIDNKKWTSKFIRQCKNITQTLKKQTEKQVKGQNYVIIFHRQLVVLRRSFHYQICSDQSPTITYFVLTEYALTGYAYTDSALTDSGYIEYASTESPKTESAQTYNNSEILFIREQSSPANRILQMPRRCP